MFWVVALFATIPDLLTIADAVAERTRPGRHSFIRPHLAWGVRAR
jgi:hypothetical protein